MGYLKKWIDDLKCQGYSWQKTNFKTTDKQYWQNLFLRYLLRWKIQEGGIFVFAVIKTGGKQYVVKPGDKIKVEKVEANVGDTIEIKEVLLVSKEGEIKLGNPLVEGVKVIASVVEHSKGPKVIVFKKKPKKGYKRKRGHRQLITTLEIKEIL